MDNRKLKILLINHSDTKGGASVVSYRLMTALCNEGADARMLVVSKNTDSLRVAEAAGRRRSRLPFLAEHADIFLRNGRNRDTLFRISTGKYGLPLSRHPWVREADVIIVNWINQGMLALKEIARIAAMKPVIWTMHDLWNMTGVCHYPDGCTRWENDRCRDCPLVGRGNLAHKVYMAKERLYKNSNIHFVAVSNRVFELCSRSPLMRDVEMSVIPNAFPIEKFGITPKLTRRQAGLPEKGRIIAMGAARLDDPVKNLPLAIELLNRLADRTKEKGDGRDENVFRAVFYGNIRNPEILTSLRMPYTFLGSVESHDRLQSIMAHTDVVLSTSVWETLPGTVVEGVACGAVGVTTGCGGQSDIIRSGVTGYILPDDGGDIDASVDVLLNALAMPQDKAAREERHRLMGATFSSQAVARDYLHLIDRLC